QHQDVLAIVREGHQVGLPMAGAGARGNGGGAPVEADASGDVQRRAAASARAASAPIFAARQVMAPAEVVVPVDLGVDEPVDGLCPYRRAVTPAASGDLLGRPAGGKPGQDL